MNDAARQTQAVREYARRFSSGDRAGWRDLFTDRPEIVEPADAPPRQSRAPLEEAFDRVAAAGIRIALEPLQIIANGEDAAVHMQVDAVMPDGTTSRSSVIEIFSFEESGKIRRMRAFLPRGLG